jgi:hypothetical protein
MCALRVWIIDFQIYAQAFQHASSNTFAFANKAQEEVLGADVAVPDRIAGMCCPEGCRPLP